MSVINYLVLYWKPLSLSSIFVITGCLSSQLLLLPLGGLYLTAYIILVGISSTWISFVAMQNFLQQNKQVDLPKILKLDKVDDKFQETERLDSFASVKDLVTDIDNYFIEKWFIYISKDQTFNKESGIVLEEIIKKLINVQVNLDHQVIIHGVLNLYLKHLKEFRRSLKRRDKYLGKISDLYQYSHSCSISTKAKNYFIHQVTINFLNHFINWELSNSLPYQILVSIISKKVLLYIFNLLSDPEILNYYILLICGSELKKSEINLNNYNRVQIIKFSEKGDITPTDLVKSASCNNLTNVERKLDAPQTKFVKDSDDIQTQNVKIYEPRSFKAWYDSVDLSSIPLGQDMLDTIDLQVIDNRRENSAVHDKDVLSPIASAKILLDEVKHITNFESLKTSMRPISEATASTLHNIKDLQESTVNSVVKPVSQVTSTALHKIGGLHLQDEAAGVVEGILDFGITRIRKGLRLTGLQDAPPGEGIRIPEKKQITRLPHVKSQEKSEDAETTWINPIQEEQPIMEKSDAKAELLGKIPSITTNDEGSPELEYEETADLATSIAKLRSLLEQKSSESNISTPALSPMPTDEMISNKILLENEDGDETDGVMPSFYKFCAKTATGVIHNTLNTIKTALPSNVSEIDGYDGSMKWLFVEANSKESDLSVRMQKLLHERKIFCTVDTAYEAIDSLESLRDTDKLRQSSIQFEDELDDFEVKLPITKALFDIMCELLSDNKETSITQEPVVKSIFLLFGNYIEETIVSRSSYYLRYYCANAKIPSESKIQTLTIGIDEFIDVVLSSIPDYIKCLLGEKTLKDLANLFVSSLQVQKINQDLLMQIVEIICLKLMEGSKQLTPITT